MSAFDGRASMMTAAREVKEASVMALHAKTFGAWVNSHLRHKNLRVNDLSTDLRDGQMLIALLEQLSGQTCELRYNKAPTLQMHLLDNQAIALQFASRFLKLNFDPKDLVDGNLKVTLALIWRLILHFQLFQTGLVPASSGAPLDSSNPASRKVMQDALLQWTRFQTAGYAHVPPLHDFSSASWGDGMGLCALIHKICPSAIDYRQLTPARPYDNLRLAFTLAAQHLDVPVLIDPADMVNPDPSLRPDENCIITYLSLFPAAAARYAALHPPAPAPSLPPPVPAPAPAVPLPVPVPVVQHPVPFQLPPSDSSAYGPDLGVSRPSGSGSGFGSGFGSGSGSGAPIIILDVVVIEARGLNTVGVLNSRPDPYAVLTCWRQKEKTKKVHS
ncbi:MAG: hypothetical protein Q8P67_21755, partial [archaeon]|nr:hypothetical protein [archaeon]